jgi:predicted DsbA family dithiol-disulfide isomerase
LLWREDGIGLIVEGLLEPGPIHPSVSVLMRHKIMTKQTNLFVLILLLFTLGTAGCKSPEHVDDPDSGLNPGMALLSGCPDGFSDLFDNSMAPYIGGDQEVLVEVSISSDFHCPFCRMLAFDLETFFEDPDHLDYVRLYFHHYPLSMHPDSMAIHMASVAAANQSMDKFWLLHDEIFTRESQNDRMTIEEVVAFAQNVLELDMEQFEADRVSQETADFIQADKEQAISQGLTGTPTVWVCGSKINWPDLDQVVDDLLGVE